MGTRARAKPCSVSWQEGCGGEGVAHAVVVSRRQGARGAARRAGCTCSAWPPSLNGTEPNAQLCPSPEQSTARLPAAASGNLQFECPSSQQQLLVWKTRPKQCVLRLLFYAIIDPVLLLAAAGVPLRRPAPGTLLAPPLVSCSGECSVPQSRPRGQIVGAYLCGMNPLSGHASARSWIADACLCGIDPLLQGHASGLLTVVPVRD